VIQGTFGDAPEIVQIEGHGNGMNVLDITEETRLEIMSGAPWKAEEPKFEAGRGPVVVKVVDPMGVVEDDYTLKFDSVNYFYSENGVMNGKAIDANWYIYNSKGDTVYSESMIANNYEQLILDWGLAINITQYEIPIRYGAINNGSWRPRSSTRIRVTLADFHTRR
jgi:hypothetical protein